MRCTVIMTDIKISWEMGKWHLDVKGGTRITIFPIATQSRIVFRQDWLLFQGNRLHFACIHLLSATEETPGSSQS